MNRLQKRRWFGYALAVILVSWGLHISLAYRGVCGRFGDSMDLWVFVFTKSCNNPEN